MQQTRLNQIFVLTGRRLGDFFGNPWRRLSLIIISGLLGNVLSVFVSATTGQAAAWDPVVAVILMVIVESISAVFYGRKKSDRPPENRKTPLGLELLQVLKLGFIFGMFVESLKLGS